MNSKPRPTPEIPETPPYRPGELRIVRSMNAPISADTAYRVEETAKPHVQVSGKELMAENDALLLMRDLDSPYPGPRYPDDPYNHWLHRK